MKRMYRFFGITMMLLLFANPAAAVDGPGVCNFVIDLKLTAYIQASPEPGINDPLGSDVYKHVVTKVKVTTADIIKKIAQASSQPVPPKGARIALYTSGAYGGQACVLALDNFPIAGFAPISSTILEFDSSDAVKEGSWTDSATGKEKKKYWELVELMLQFGPADTLHIGGPIVGKYTEVFGPGGAITDVIKGSVSGVGLFDDATTVVTGKISGKLIVGVMP